jgi:hypothetical protein
VQSVWVMEDRTGALTNDQNGTPKPHPGEHGTGDHGGTYSPSLATCRGQPIKAKVPPAPWWHSQDEAAHTHGLRTRGQPDVLREIRQSRAARYRYAATSIVNRTAGTFV